MFLAVKLSPDLEHILEVSEAESHGVAYRKVLDFTDQGYPGRIITPDESQSFLFDYNQMMEVREKGFNPERGSIPNGIMKRKMVKHVG
jgi:hypothetical protein